MGDGEHVVEHEGDPLSRIEPVEDDEECVAHRIGEYGLILRCHCSS